MKHDVKQEIELKIKSMLGFHGDIQGDDDLTLLGMHSLRTVEFIVEMEKQFGVAVHDDELILDQFTTVNMITEFFENKLRAL